MGQLISVSIALAKIDKTRFTTDKNGNKYLQLTLSVNDEADQYGKDVQVWMEQTKEEREAKASRVFCGNGKVVFGKGAAPAPASAGKPATPNASDDDPFA